MHIMLLILAEELEKMRELAKKAKMPNWQYNVYYKKLYEKLFNSFKREKLKTDFLENGDPCAIRIKMPRNEDISFYDEIRGWVV